MNEKLAVLGAGNMGEAIIAGMLANGTIEATQVVCVDQSVARMQLMADTYGVRSASAAEAIAFADVVLLAVKPQNVPALMKETGPLFTASQTVVSIVAGVPTATYQAGIDADVAIVRAMPNTPAQLGAGVTAMALADGSRTEALRVANEIFGSVGSVVTVTEDKLDAVTAVSGSGPAYLFMFAEALVAAGVAEGLDEDTAQKLAIHTIYGSGVMLRDSGRLPGELREMVSSPGGTTLAALASFTDHGFHETVVAAVAAAARRAQELAAETA